MGDGDFGESLAIESDPLLLHRLDESRVRNTFRADGGTETHDPQRSETALLQATIFVRIHAGANDRLVRLGKGGPAHSAVALREGADLLVSAVPDDASLNAHKSEEIRDWEGVLQSGLCPRDGR